MTLLELTGQESGLVIYWGEGMAEGIVCNWASACHAEESEIELPRVFSGDLFFMAAEVEHISEPTEFGLGAHFAEYNADTIAWIYDANGDMARPLPESGTSWTISTPGGVVQVIAPEGWC